MNSRNMVFGVLVSLMMVSSVTYAGPFVVKNPLFPGQSPEFINFFDWDDAQREASKSDGIVIVDSNVPITQNINVSENLTIVADGNNQAVAIFEGNGFGPIINIEPGVTVTINHLKLFPNTTRMGLVGSLQSTVNIFDTAIEQADIGIAIGGSSNNTTSGTWVIDSNTLIGNREAIAVSGNMESITITGNIIVGSTGDGVIVDATGGPISFFGNTVTNNARSGIKVFQTAELFVSGNYIEKNGVSGGGAHFGISIEATTMTTANITTNNILLNGPNGTDQLFTNTNQVSAIHNWWGTANRTEVLTHVSGSGSAEVEPFLLGDFTTNPGLSTTTNNTTTSNATSNVTSRVLVSVTDGDWASSTTWQDQATSAAATPNVADFVAIFHTVTLNKPASGEPTPSVKLVRIHTPGSLIIASANATNQLKIEETMEVSGNLVIAEFGRLSFTGQTSQEGIVVEEVGHLILAGALDGTAPAIVEGVNSFIDFHIKGGLTAEQFEFNKTKGLIVEESAQVMGFYDGVIADVNSTSPHLEAAVPVRGHRVVFDRSGASSGQSNVIASGNASVWMIDGTRNNTLTDTGAVSWVTSADLGATALTDQAARWQVSPHGGSAGSVFGDINNDGRSDLMVTQLLTAGSTSIPDGFQGIRLFVNRGDHFEDITDSSGIAAREPIAGGIMFDFDQDEDEDILLYGPSHGVSLWENDGDETFSDVSFLITNHVPANDPYVSATWTDVTQDGVPDLYLSAEFQEFILVQQEGIGGFFVEGLLDRGSFIQSQTDETLQTQAVNFGGLVDSTVFDVDNNGLPDFIRIYQTGLDILYMVQNTDPNSNHVSTDFERLELQYPFPVQFSPTGVHVADFNGDGFFDLYLTTQGNQYVWVENQNLDFRRKINSFAFRILPGKAQNHFGAVFEDVNNDGALDVLVPDNVVDIESTPPVIALKSKSGFVFEESSATPFLAQGPVGVSQADINRDGVPDYYVTSFGGANGLFFGDRNQDNWLSVVVRGDLDSHVDAWGSRIMVQTAAHTVWKPVIAEQGVGAQSGHPVFFNIKDAATIEKIKVVFPSGRIFVTENVSVSPTISIVAKESESINFVTISGQVRQPQGGIITGAELGVQVENARTGTFLNSAAVDPVTGAFEVTVNVSVQSVSFSVGKSSDGFNTTYIRQIDMILFGDLELGTLQLEDTPFQARGRVVMDGVGVSNVFVRADRDDPNNFPTDFDFGTGFSDEHGNFAISLPGGNWRVSFHDPDGNKIEGLDRFLNLPQNNHTGDVNLQGFLFDGQGPTVGISVPIANQTVSNRIDVAGVVSDNFALRNYELRVAPVGTENWESLRFDDEPITGIIASWDTRTVRDGSYKIQLSAQDSVGNFSQTIVEPIVVQNVDPASFIKKRSSGLQLVSVPFDLSPTQSFSTFLSNPNQVAKYESGRYILPGAGLFESRFEAGHGYWVDLASEVTWNASGATPFFEDLVMDFDSGWQLIGSPYSFPLNFEQLTLETSSGQRFSVEQAIEQGLVGSFLWEWVPENSVQAAHYEPIVSGIGQPALLLPWEGYWINFVEPVRLTFSDAARSSIVIQTASSLGQLIPTQFTDQNWTSEIKLRVDDQWVKTIHFGVDTGAKNGYDRRDLPRPPAAPNQSGALLYMTQTDWANRSGAYATDIREPIDAAHQWEFVIDPTDQTGRYQIEVTHLDQLPGSYSAKLLDVYQTPIADLRAQSVVELTIDQPTAFSILVEDTLKTQAGEPVQVSDFVVYPNPFNPISSTEARQTTTFEYSLSRSASGSLRLYNLQGRLIRTLDIEPVVDGGGLASLNQLTWDGRDESGVLLPDGPYIYLLQITDEDNNKTQEKGKVVLWKID